MSAAAEAGRLPVAGLPMAEMAAEPISVAMSVPMAKAVEGKMMVVVVVAVMVMEMMKVVRVVMAEEVAATEAVTAKAADAAETMSAETMRRGVDPSEDETERCKLTTAQILLESIGRPAAPMRGRHYPPDNGRIRRGCTQTSQDS